MPNPMVVRLHKLKATLMGSPVALCGRTVRTNAIAQTDGQITCAVCMAQLEKQHAQSKSQG